MLDQRAEDFIDHAVKSSEHMAELVDDLLRYSSIDQSEMMFGPTDMNAVLDSVREDLDSTIARSRGAVTNDPLPTIAADRSQMVQVFQNLVANALKFHGDQRPRVHVSAIEKGNEWLFSVEDNGIGIDPTSKDKLFEMFSRIHPRSEYEGTGIGLATVKRVVERTVGRCGSSPRW